ncbi:MAG: EAL domain-containing protein, partial [Proteobacteria bacterium]|nr:EAL domain-containing protein [Pseudomonadota bacterium]
VCLSDLNNLNNINAITQNILQEMTNPFHINNEQFFLSASIGITLYPDDATSVQDLLKNADQAMFHAKANGRNRSHYFTSSMQKEALYRKEITKDLRTALDKDQFTVHYQPIVEMMTGNIFKAEALIRWQHPERGFISPVDFIPVAEESGLIVGIGDWVFHTASQQAEKWRQIYNEDFQVSINKSPRQFQKEGDSAQDYLDFLNKHDLSTQGIVIEITEGLLMDSNTSVTDQLRTFRDAGIKVSLDDFGTGYSSLSYLRKFDMDYLKIDRSFVQNLVEDTADQALCEAIIVMAHKLGIKVIAEGIETEQQREFLFNAGCDYGQGYLFSKPVPADEFEKLLSNN